MTDLSDKGLISRIYKKTSKIKNKKDSKMGKGFEQTFPQRYTNGQ